MGAYWYWTGTHPAQAAGSIKHWRRGDASILWRAFGGVRTNICTKDIPTYLRLQNPRELHSTYDATVVQKLKLWHRDAGQAQMASSHGLSCGNSSVKLKHNPMTWGGYPAALRRAGGGAGGRETILASGPTRRLYRQPAAVAVWLAQAQPTAR